MIYVLVCLSKNIVELFESRADAECFAFNNGIDSPIIFERKFPL